MRKYEKLTEQLIISISSNMKKGIYKLPTETELCRQYQVSRQTVRTALSLLQKRGIITSRQGSGSYATGLSADSILNTIPILIFSDQDYIYPRLLADIRSALAEQNYTLNVLPTGNSTYTERQYLQELLSDPPRAMIVEGCQSALPNPNMDLYAKLQQSGTFVLFLHSSYAALPDTVCVKDDNYYGGYLLAEHLLSLGHTRIAGLFKVDDLQGPERYLGAATCLRDLGHTMPDRHIRWFTSREHTALEKKQDTRFLTSFIQNELAGCSAVICYNDEIAYWLLKELEYADIHVPEQVSVVCFDNSYLSKISKTRITSLSHNPHEIGNCAAEYIIQKLKGNSVVSREIPWYLVHGESAARFQA